MADRKSLVLLIILILAVLPQTAAAQQSGELQEVSARIAGSIFVGGHSIDYLQDLSDKFGGRLTGSPAHRSAAEWAAAKFHAAGINNVRLEPFTIPNGWERGWAQGRILVPMERPLHIESYGWAPSTPSGGVKGELILMSDISPEKIKAEADRIKGRIVMLDREAIFAEGLNGYANFFAAQQSLKDAGVAAILMPDQDSSNVLNAHSATLGGQIAPIPIAEVGLEDAKLIRRLLEKGPVTVDFQYENRVTGPVEVNNVIAEIPGREKPDEWIIIGAHLDSWDYGTGAQDNGSGCAMVLEAARALAMLGQAPRRSIRFALWGGEEQGLLGSTAYVRAHFAELGKCVAALNTDNGAGHPRGWKVEGRNDLSEAMKSISNSLLSGLNGDGLSQVMTLDTDHCPFMLEGIPALDLWVDMAHYGEIHHKSSDTFDKVNTHNLAAGTAVVAVTAYAIAERAEPVAPHIDHSAVEQILKKAKLYDFLKAVGAWK